MEEVKLKNSVETHYHLLGHDYTGAKNMICDNSTVGTIISK